MTAAAAAALLAGAAGLVAVADRPGLTRLSRVTGSDPPVMTRSGDTVVPARLRARLARGLALAAVVAAFVDLGTAAVILGVAAIGMGIRAARDGRAEAEERAAAARDLPRAAELLATCLEAGAAPGSALAVVAGAVAGPVGHRLRVVAALLLSGADLHTVPGPSATPPHPVDRLVRAVVRAGGTGAPLARTVREVAADERARHRAAAEERARAVGVRAVGPLAVCFLPAFVLLGVVPVVVGVARSVLAATQ